MIEITIETTSTIVTATEVTYDITVTSDNSLFTVTNVDYNFTVTNTVNQMSFDDGSGPGFDPAVKFRGDWESGTAYTRNDLVNYQYSLYVCQIEYNSILTSTTPPPDDTASWIRIVWKEAPFAWVTSTGFVDVGTNLSVGASARIAGNLGVTGTAAILGSTDIGGSLDIGGSTDIGGSLNVTGPLTVTNNTGTFRDLNVSRQFNINGLNYPVQKGSFGQVLTTNGSTTATWTNLGDLQSWSLNEDLYTNEFNIVTGIDKTQAPSQVLYKDLTIGSGETGDFQAYLRFVGGESGTMIPTVPSSITLYTDGNLSLTGQDLVTITSPQVSTTSKLRVGGFFTATSNAYIQGNLYVTGLVSGQGNVDPVRVGSGGIIFTDGTVQLSASTSTGFTVTQIASTTTLGVIRVGDYLTLNTATGVLSVDRFALRASQSWYTLPFATSSTLGGIRVGNGLAIDEVGILSVASTLTDVLVGNVSLTSDMYTNNYKIQYSASDSSSYLRLESSGRMTLYGSDITIGRSNAQIVTDVAMNTVYIKGYDTVLGTDAGNSTLQVNRIYNYAGTNAPFFPAGVQYPDNSIQITAFYPDQGLLI